MGTLTVRDRFALAKLAMSTALGKAPKPTEARGSIEILDRMLGHSVAGSPPDRGAQGILDSYATMPWMRAVAGRVASSIAAVQWKLYAVVPARQTRAVLAPAIQCADAQTRSALLQSRLEAGELREIPEHLFLTALTRGNGVHSGVAFKRLTQLSIDLVGESFWLKGRNRLGVPVAFWPIPTTWVQETPTPARPVFRIAHLGWHEEIPQHEIAWICDPNPANPYGRGVGYGQSLSDELEIDEYAAKTARQLFFNKASPDFIVFPKGERAEMHAPELARFEQDWLDKLQGYWRAWKPYFLSREVGVYEFAKDFQALQLVPIRNQERDIILQVWGLPPEKFGILGTSNRSTIDESDNIYAKDVLIPRLEFLRSYFQEQLIPEYDPRLIIDYVTPVSADREYNLKVAQAAPYALDGNEWRALMGQPADPALDGVHFVPPAYTPVSAEDITTATTDAGVPDEVPPPMAEPRKSLGTVMADAIAKLVSPVIQTTVNIPERPVTIGKTEVHVAPPAVKVDVQPSSIEIHPRVEVQVPPPTRLARRAVFDAAGRLVKMVDEPHVST